MFNDERILNVRGLAVSLNCEGCPCSREGKPQRAVRAFGSPGGLCIVGEGPGQDELLQGYPFIGPSGKVVTKALKLASIDRAYTWITNAILCKRPGSDDAFAVAVEHCRSRLQADLTTGRPTAIAALGGTAMRALQLPVTFVSEARGTVQYSPLAPNVPVIGSIHPAAILRGGAGEMTGGGKQKMSVDAQAMFLFADIAKAGQVACGSVSPTWSDDIRVVFESSEVATEMKAILQDVYEDGILGLDLEWVCDGSKNPLDALGAEAHRAVITFCGVGCTRRAVSFKWDAITADYHERAMEFPIDEESGVKDSGLARLQAAMEDENIAKIVHNKQADRSIWEAQVGPINGRVLDTMLMHHCACPGIDHDLQQVTSQYLCVPPWKIDHKRDVREYEAQLRQEAKVRKEIERECRKAERKTDHDRRNAELHAEKLARKARRQAERDLQREAQRLAKQLQLSLKGA